MLLMPLHLAGGCSKSTAYASFSRLELHGSVETTARCGSRQRNSLRLYGAIG